MKKVWLRIILSIMIPVFPLITFADTFPQFNSEKFMGVEGGKFSNDFRFMGANLDPWRFITDAGEEYSQEDIEAWVVNALSYTGAKVIRMHMNGGAFEPTVGAYGEPSFKQLDYLIAVAAKHHVYVLISLRDYLWTPWPYSAYDPYWYLGGGSKANPNKGAIMHNKKAKEAFKKYIAYVLSRENTVTRTKYRDEPWIMGWELINEPPIYPGETKSWLEEMGAYIKSIDPNHLVGIALAGIEDKWWEPNAPNWDELKTPQLDFIDIHYYADARLYSEPIDQGNVKRFKQRLKSALALKKPIIVGEFGCIHTVGLPLIKNLYQTIINNSFESGVSGVIPFSWGPLGPNGWGGPGSYNTYIEDKELCDVLKSLAPN